MVRSKRKWKKDSPEKLTQRIENEIQLRKNKPPEIKSPESKKSKGTGEIPSDFSSGVSEPLVNTFDTQSTLANEQASANIDTLVVANQKEMETKTPDQCESDRVAKETTPPIEETLNVITQSLSTLTETIAAMSMNMVCKTDIAVLQNEMVSQGKQIVNNREQIKTKMSLEEGNQMAKKIKEHDVILKNTADNMETQDEKSRLLEGKLKQNEERDMNRSNRIDGLAEALKKKSEETHKELEDIKRRLSEQNSELLTLRNSQNVRTAPLPGNIGPPNHEDPSDQWNKNPRLNVIIEGLPENEDENLNEKIKQLCEKMGEDIDQCNIVAAWRIKRKIPLVNKPNPVKICFANYQTKEQIMRSKYKLRPTPETSRIWINHDESIAVRRAKGRARFIASFSRKKGSQAELTPRGIVLDSVFYSFENLDSIPSIYIPPANLDIRAPAEHNIAPREQPLQKPINRAEEPAAWVRTPQSRQPIEPISLEDQTRRNNNASKHSPKIARTKKVQKMRLTASGLVYSGPTAIFSHLYKAQFKIDDTPYNSVEQKIQYEKAMMADDIQAAELIMNTQDTWTIKDIGNRVKVTKEYLDNRLHIARIGNVAKFRDNPDLMEALLETGDLNLIEGTKSAFWGGGEEYESDAYDNEDIHGKNHQGYMVIGIRTTERKRRAGIVL